MVVGHVSAQVPANSLRKAYFGDLHVHSLNSYDAYRYVQGDAIMHTLGYPIRLLGKPRDFLADTDHAEFLGVPAEMAKLETVFGLYPLVKSARSSEPKENRTFTRAFDLANVDAAPLVPAPDVSAAVESTWCETIAAAERYNQPGRFITFIAYKCSSAPDYANL